MCILDGVHRQKRKYQTCGVNNINGMFYDSGRDRTDKATFWRDRTRYAPHNAYTNTEKILKVAEDKGYRTTSDEESVLNYVADEVMLESGQDATKISIPYYGSYNVVSYKYDSENKVYERYSKGRKQVSAETSKPITAKNIIITFAGNATISDGSRKGRQDLDNIKKLKGYYITNGKAIKITCEKKSHKDKTIYRDLEGNEIQVNDGNTYINICPLKAKITIK